MRPVRLLALAVLAVVAVPLAGCAPSTPPPPLPEAVGVGSSGPAASGSVAGRPAGAPSRPAGRRLADLPATEILARAKAALQQVRSVHLVGTKDTGSGRLTTDVRVKAGRGGGTITLDSHVFRFVRIGEAIYFKADAAWYAELGLSRYANQLGGRYARMAATTPGLRPVLDFTSLTGLAHLALDATGMALTKAEGKSIRGIPAVGLVESASDRNRVLYIALTGPPLPLELNAATDVDEPTSFIDYNKPVSLAAPPANQVVDLAPSVVDCPSGTPTPQRHHAISPRSGGLALVPPVGGGCFTSPSANP